MAFNSGSMKCTSINGVKVYSFIGHQRPLSTLLNPNKLRALRKDKEYMERVELLQDLRFETAATKIKATPDGEYLISSGIHPPQIKVHEFRELAFKFERTFDSEIVDMKVLGDDYSKLAFLCMDRSIVLHAKYGKHYSLRIPRMGRGIDYDCWSCDLLCAASSPDLYRINLEQGRFLSPLSTRSPALNVVSRSKLHGLVACGGEDGAVECFDMRVKSSVGRIIAGGDDKGVTAISFDEDAGFNMAVGNSDGKVLIYDLRSSSPVYIKDHKYGSPILDIKWHRTLNSEETKLITTDKHIVRLWDPKTGEGITSIEPTGGAINDICVFRESGLILLALDASFIQPHFMPSLGPAPKWISSLENLTDELEESKEASIYEEYKFLTKEELERLKLQDYIGTSLLKAQMHGFFIKYELYKQAKDIVDPSSYEAYKEEQTKKKLEKTYDNRITIKRKLPKVNRKLASALYEVEEAEKERIEAGLGDKKGSKKNKRLDTKLLNDPRFAPMFEDKNFKVDEQSDEYLALHRTSMKNAPIKEHFDPILEETDESDELSDSEDDVSDEDGRPGKKRGPRLFEVKDERHADAFFNNISLADEEALPLGERVASLRGGQHGSRFGKHVKVGPGGSREISFISRNSAKYKEDEDDDRRGKRRGVQSLGLKGPAPMFRGGGRGGRGRDGGRGRGGGGRGAGRGRGRGRGSR